MSYTLHIWKDPTELQALADVDEALETLRGQMYAVPEPRFRSFLDKVHEYYGEYPDSDIPELWNESPELGTQALLVLGIVTGELTRALPTIQTAARECGLVYYDGQAGELRMPDGTVVDGQGRRHDVVEPLSQLNLADEFCDWNVTLFLKHKIGLALQPYGFLPIRGEYWFEKDTPQFKIFFYGHLRWGGFKIWMPVFMQTPQGRPELQKYCDDCWCLDVDFSALGQSYEQMPPNGMYESGHRMPANDWAQVQDSSNMLCELLGSPALAFLGAVDDLPALDRWANRVEDGTSPFRNARVRTPESGLMHLGTHADLLIAHLAGSPEFVEQALERLAACEAGDELAKRVGIGLQEFLNAAGWCGPAHR